MSRVALQLLFLVAAQAALADERPNIIVFYTDDHGYADLSCQGVFDDISTPNVDALARDGVRAIHGYSTAPQCVPSRAGLLVGKFQSRFGVEANRMPLDGFDRELTIAERLRAAGYVTGQFGKWHLGPGPQITRHGFRYVYNQSGQKAFAANITTDGTDRPMGRIEPDMYHVDGCSHAASAIITRHKDDPFFLYIAYRAPHVPLDAPRSYLDRFPGEMPERRRQALAMLSAVDDGVGLMMKTLARHGLTEKTLIFYIGDNGAPLKIHKRDTPGGGPGWDGSLNDPLNGEKGMLAEGGMHVPFVVSWPGTIPGGQQYPHPISALDVAATASAVAGLETKPGALDGVNLVPFLSGQNAEPPHESLMWRWVSQSAIREGNWKLLRGGSREYLYDLQSDLEERSNVAEKYPDVADRLRKKLTAWSQELSPPGLAIARQSEVWNDYFDFYLDGKKPKPRRTNAAPKKRARSAKPTGSWMVRNGTLTVSDNVTRVAAKGRKRPALIRNQMRLRGPVSIEMTVRSEMAHPIGLAWRTRQDKKFPRKNQLSMPLKSSSEWQTLSAEIPGGATVVHVRFEWAGGDVEIQSLKLSPAKGKSITLPD